VQNPPDLGNRCSESPRASGFYQTQTGSEFALSIKFRMRAKRDRQVVRVRGRLVASSFRDVRRDGGRGSAHLLRESEPFAWRTVFSELVDLNGNRHRLLPRNQFPEARHLRHTRRSGKNYSLLPTPYSL
jgi:hypothetical protein